jgi:hypothetical protein
MIAAEETVIEAVRAILPIARQTLLQDGSHLPTALLHTFDGILPYVLPFKDDEEKKALTKYVRELALEKHAYAVTMVTCARVIDSRTGEEKESLVLATSIQGGSPHVLTQGFTRGPDRRVVAFAEPEEGDHAALPGQMFIIPTWDDEIGH